MQREKHDVRHGAHLKHVRAEEARALELALRAHGLQIRGRGQDPVVAAQAVQRRRIVKHTGDIARVVLQAEEHIQQHDLMAVFLQRAGNFRAARDRDVALRAQTAAKNCNFHWDSPFVFS